MVDPTPHPPPPTPHYPQPPPHPTAPLHPHPHPIPLPTTGNSWKLNKQISEMQALLAACRELAVDYNTLRQVLYVFEHKT